MAARVAVAMAVYNEERYLPIALEALCRQSFRDFELFVVDDGSTDGSAGVVESFAARLPLQLTRAEHRGRQLTKQASWSVAKTGEYLLVLDADIALPPDALARMVATLDTDAKVAAVSAVARADTGRRYGAAQAFIEDVFFHSNRASNGDSRWIVGGCVLFRRSALADIEVRTDVGEDNDLSEKLRQRWRLVVRDDVQATHYGVPTTLRGIFKRFERDGERVRALLRVYPQARQLGNIARLVPLPLLAVGVTGAVTGQLWATGGAAAALGAYIGAFLYASRQVPAPVSDRLVGALLFTFGNVGFGVGYAQEALRMRSGGVLRERRRSY